MSNKLKKRESIQNKARHKSIMDRINSMPFDATPYSMTFFKETFDLSEMDFSKDDSKLKEFISSKLSNLEEPNSKVSYYMWQIFDQKKESDLNIEKKISILNDISFRFKDFLSEDAIKYLYKHLE